MFRYTERWAHAFGSHVAARDSDRGRAVIALKRVRYSPIVLLAVLAAATVSASSAKRTTSGAFLKYRIASVGQLCDQVSREKSVAQLYGKHFRMSPSAVVEYFREHLHLAKLSRPMQFAVYGVTPAGRIFVKHRTLSKGTAVFITETGKVVLRGMCGNPLRARLPVIVGAIDKEAQPRPAKASGKRKAAISIPKSTQEMAQLPEIKGEAAPAGEEIVTKTLGAPGEIAPAPIEILPTEPALVEMATAPVPSPFEADMPSYVSQVPPGSEPVNVMPPLVRDRSLGFLPFLPLIGLGLGGGGGGGDIENPPVPEPSTCVALSAGLATLIAAGVRRRRR